MIPCKPLYCERDQALKMFDKESKKPRFRTMSIILKKIEIWILMWQLQISFFLPSEHESFGLLALQAIDYGGSVLATNFGGLPEVVRHGNLMT